MFKKIFLTCILLALTFAVGLSHAIPFIHKSVSHHMRQGFITIFLLGESGIGKGSRSSHYGNF